MNKQNIPKNHAAILDVHSPIYLKSFESRYCGGDIGDIYPLIDRASEAGFGYLQFTPIQDTGHSPCPYMGRSIFSYNPIYLSVNQFESKVDLNEIDASFLKGIKDNKLDHVSYRRLYNYKIKILRKLFDSSDCIDPLRTETNDQLLAYAVFCALHNMFRSKWIKWPDKYKFSSPRDIIKNYPRLHREINFYLFSQKILANQWKELNKFAAKKGIKLILDKPIYPVHNSAEVWANKELFYLNKDGTLKYASGCNNPKDPFGAQYWGHAVYKFKQKPDEVIKYFIESVKFISQTASVIRLDHTLALVWKYYIMKPKTDSGKHINAIRHKLFNALVSSFSEVTFIAEDLGYVSKRNVDDPLAKHNIPGMRSPQWCHIPKYANISRYPELCMAMTSNHDLDSLPRWWQKLRQSRKQIILKQVQGDVADNSNDQIWQIVELIFGSESMFASITLRDLTFDLRRYNKPGTKNSQNWTQRMHINIEEVDFTRINSVINRSSR